MSDDRRVIVIGSGPTGSMAALSLLERGIPVTMLESGLDVPPGLLVRVMGRNVYRRWPNFDDRNHRHSASADPTAAWIHEFVPGGMSNYWTGAVPRFAPEDFFEGERLHERYRWPISYADLVPYYEQAERLLTVVADNRDMPALPASCAAFRHQLPRQWQHIASSAASFGQGLTPVPIADGSPWIVSRTAAAFNSYTRIVSKLRRNPHFQLVLGAHALRLEWCGEKRRVTGVTYHDRATNTQKRLTAAAAVVAAGPLSSTKLLFDSACGDFPDGLGNTEGLLGHYLHDHVIGWCVIETDKRVPRFRQAAYLTRRLYDESPPLLAAGCVLGKSDSTRLTKVIALTPLKSNAFGVVTMGTVVPVSEHYVRPDPTMTDSMGLPTLDVHIRHDEQALENVVAAQERLLAILEAAGYKGTIRDRAIKVPGSSVHYGGTVRMHKSPAYGMLDGWNRLRSVGNVVVVDASCFTTGVEKNPTLTAMAIAARASAQLAEDLKTAQISL